ncbi:MAG: hypothetical protein Q4G08_02165 [Capnocytophaga sp.]|nr:hypothetical protein [Capnocytophaga sp.]
MPRIYYRVKKLYGEAFDNETINIDNFNKILQHRPFLSDEKRRVMITLPQNQSFSLFRRQPKSFKNAVVWGNSMDYDTNEYGDFFLPKAVVLFDEKDAYFPSKYFFIALIDGHLEVCQCKAGEDTMWFQQAELHSVITEESDIQRIEKSVKELLELAGHKLKIQKKK